MKYKDTEGKVTIPKLRKFATVTFSGPTGCGKTTVGRMIKNMILKSDNLSYKTEKYTKGEIITVFKEE